MSNMSNYLEQEEEYLDVVNNHTEFKMKDLKCEKCQTIWTTLIVKSCETYNGFCYEPYTQVTAECECGNEESEDAWETVETEEGMKDVAIALITTAFSDFTYLDE